MAASATVRLRLTVLAVVVVGVGLIAGGGAVVALVRNDLTGSAEDTALLRAEAVAASGDPIALTQIVARDGTIVATSPDLQHVRLLAEWPSNGTVHGTTRLPDREHYAVAGVASGANAVYAAASLEHAAEAAEATLSALVATVPLLLVAVAGTAWLLVGRALRPVEAIRNQVSEITASQLDRRVPEPAADDEVGRLARTMNEMLTRLEQAHERQERFTTDAAHELRSPLAAVRTRLEIGLAHPDRTDWVRLARELHREGARLSDLTDQLLALARNDGAQETVEWVDLDELVLAEIEAVRSRSTVEVELSPFSAARLRGRAGELSRVVRNLLDNAERHAQHKITVGLSTANGFAELEVADDGPGIPADDRALVFERFYRAQPARERDSGGAGLGLAIVREVTEAHGGQVWLGNSPVGARFHVRLPLPVDD